MISRLIAGKGFRGALEYVFGPGEHNDPHRATLISTNLAGATPQQMAREMAKLKDLNRRVKKPVKHIPISFKKGETPTDQQMKEIGEAYLEKMGYGNCPFVIVKHTDTLEKEYSPSPMDGLMDEEAREIEIEIEEGGCSHFHIVTSRIDLDGKTVSDSNERFRSLDTLKELSVKHGFYVVDLKSMQDNMNKEAAKQRYNIYENKNNKRRKYMNKPQQQFSMSPKTISNKPKPDWSKEESEQARQLQYPLSTIFKMMYLQYHYSFLEDEEFYNLMRMERGHNQIMFITKSNDKIADNGNNISLVNGPASKENIAMMCKLAKSKNWETVEFKGTDEFLLEAWKQAQELGLKVSPTTDQEALFKKFSAENKPTDTPEAPSMKQVEPKPEVEPLPVEEIEPPKPKKGMKL